MTRFTIVNDPESENTSMTYEIVTEPEGTFRTDYHDSETDVHHWLNTHIPCPFDTEVEKKAWCEGYTKATKDSNEEAHGWLADNTERANPYTSGDTTMAWHQGYEDYAYRPAPFDPNDIPLSADVTVRFLVIEQGAWEREVRILWVDNASKGSQRRQPWADNREKDRSILLPWSQAQYLIRSGMANKDILTDGSFELPCPPYTYKYSDGGMSISAGKFTKWGTKEDWETVVAEMQEKVDEMPEGIDISMGYVELDVTATVTFSVSVPMTVLVASEDGIFHGDEDQLTDALTDGVEYGDFSEYVEDSFDINAVDWSIEPQDIGYDVRNL